MANQGPTSSDFTRMANASKELAQSVKHLTDSMRALNTNLVAIHEVLRELKEKENE